MVRASPARLVAAATHALCSSGSSRDCSDVATRKPFRCCGLGKVIAIPFCFCICICTITTRNQARTYKGRRAWKETAAHTATALRAADFAVAEVAEADLSVAEAAIAVITTTAVTAVATAADTVASRAAVAATTLQKCRGQALLSSRRPPA